MPCRRDDGGVLYVSGGLGLLEVSEGSSLSNNSAGRRGGAVGVVGSVRATVSFGRSDQVLI